MINKAIEKIESKRLNSFLYFAGTKQRIDQIDKMDVFNFLIEKGYVSFRKDRAFAFSFDTCRWFLCTQNGFHRDIESRYYLNENGLAELDRWLTYHVLSSNPHFKETGGRVLLYDYNEWRITPQIEVFPSLL